MIDAARIAIACVTVLSAIGAAAGPRRVIEAPEDYTYGCTLAEARPVPLRELQRNPAAFLRQCVRIEGISGGREVFADIGNLYRHWTQMISGAPEGIGVGLYWGKRSVGQIAFRERVEIIGRAFSCSEIYREAQEAQDEQFAGAAVPPPPPMLAGYCHYYGDAIVHVAQARIVDPGPLRLTGPDAASDFGDLEDLRATDERYSDVWKRVTQWFDAVRRSSSPQYDDFMTSHCGGAQNLTAEERKAEDECRKTQQQRLAALGAGSLPPIRFYLRKTKPAYSLSQGYLAIGCVCRTANCEGIWPIHSFDADSSEWPYFCARVEREAAAFKVY